MINELSFQPTEGLVQGSYNTTLEKNNYFKWNESCFSLSLTEE